MALLVSVFAAFTQPASADAPSVADIERWAGDLRSGDESLIAEAAENLGQLGSDALPAIEARLQRTRRQIVPEEDGYDALRYFRHAVGSRRADDMIDIAPGIPAVVKERPSPDVGRSAERLLLLRSLEGIGSVPAQRLMGDVFALTPSMWRWERRRLLDRMGPRLLPGLLWMRAHDEPDVRRWARAAIGRLGLSEPGRAVQEEDPERLAGILEAYGATREMNAMPVVISFVGHSDTRVRQAAREAMNHFGRNGIWQLREGMRNQLGQEADHEWGWQRTSALLYEGLDAQRLAPVTEQLEQGLQLAEAGELSQARELLDAALMREPMHPRRSELAEHYARFAEAASGDEKETLLQRALWLDPDANQAAAWQRELLAVEVERNIAAGFEDVRVEAEESQDIEDTESTRADAQPERSTNYGALLGGLFVLLLLGGLVWKRTWLAERLQGLRLPRVALAPAEKDTDTDTDTDAKAKAESAEEPRLAATSVKKERFRAFLLQTKERLGPFASNALRLLLAASRRAGRELLSLGRTLARVVSPGSVAAPKRRPAKRKKAKRPKKPAAPKVLVAKKKPLPEDSAADTIPLSGLLFHVEPETTRSKDVEIDAEAPDTIDSGLESPLFDETPLDLPPGFYADTSPGTVEAPDTLPG